MSQSNVEEASCAVAAFVILGISFFFLMNVMTKGSGAPHTDPLAGCSIMSKERTGKTSTRMHGKLFVTHHETVLKYHCADGDRLVVRWE